MIILGKVITFEKNPSLLWGYCHFRFVCDHFYRVIITLDLPANPQTILGWSTPPPLFGNASIFTEILTANSNQSLNDVE